MKGAWLEDLTWPEASAWFARDPVMLVPIGAASKEHGPHLPLCTDYLLARAFCGGVIGLLPVLAAPVVSFGYYPAFRHYPGSQHLSPATFEALLREILEGFIDQGLGNLVVVNTGVSTEPVVGVLVREIYEERGVRIAVAHIRALGHAADGLFGQELGGHADEHETSIILAVAPERVRMDRAVPDYGHAREAPKSALYHPTMFTPDPASGPDFSLTGARGDPSLATAAKGRASLDASVGDIVAGIRQTFPEALERQR